MEIGDRVFINGYIDEIRKNTVIIRNNGGYFGTIPDEVITRELPYAKPKIGWWIEMVDADPMTGEPYVCGVYCSECGERIGCESNFCPNCGADMRGGSDETVAD